MKKREYENFSFRYQGRIVKIRAKICRGFWKKFIGKMFTYSKKPLIFEFRKQIKVGIHMFFVFIPLLVIWLDKKKKIMKIKIMKPFISFSSAKAKYVLEIPFKNRLASNFKHIKSH